MTQGRSIFDMLIKTEQFIDTIKRVERETLDTRKNKNNPGARAVVVDHQRECIDTGYLHRTSGPWIEPWIEELTLNKAEGNMIIDNKGLKKEEVLS